MGGAAAGAAAGGPGAVAGLAINPSDAVLLTALVVVGVVPMAAVLLVALLRGYTISLHMTRPPLERRRRRHQDD